MDKIWYRTPSKSEVIGRCGGMKQGQILGPSVFLYVQC